jgi:hypothetical protein
MNDAEAEQGRMIKITEGARRIIVFKTAEEMQLNEVASYLIFLSNYGRFGSSCGR